MDAAIQRDEQLEAFRADVLSGLAKPQKSLPSRWLYDYRGCKLFEDITRLEEYYPTRTETGILTENAPAIAEFCGKNADLLEYGAGAGIKTEILISALRDPRSYVPIDIAGSFLDHTAARFRKRFVNLPVRPIVSDFTADFSLPPWAQGGGRRVAFFPGSTIGNLSTAEAGLFLQRLRRHVGAQGAAIIGVDLKKDLSILLPAYDDRAGVTAQFNLNLLARINRELDGHFVPVTFRHLVRWNQSESAIEMHLLSMIDQLVTVAGRRFSFRTGETIHTESSRKYEVGAFKALARQHGWQTQHLWADANGMFAVFGLV